MDVIVFVDRFNGQNCLCNIKPSIILCQGVFSHKQGHHISAGQIFHDKVKIFIILKRTV
uniref:Uncharacterized protein MANES_13G035900 n=1 Tax=Rhizophora mucronata TaxID=61149 RepID=A0A2P2LIE1_RHIMU